jgi:elongation factor P--beta-lysine ligase
MRVELYARVSTDKQAEKYGIPRQIEALRKRCLERGWSTVYDGDKNAFTELNDPIEQRERFVKQQKQRQPEGEPVESVDEDFLLAMEHGMPPHRRPRRRH